MDVIESHGLSSLKIFLRLALEEQTNSDEYDFIQCVKKKKKKL